MSAGDRLHDSIVRLEKVRDELGDHTYIGNAGKNVRKALGLLKRARMRLDARDDVDQDDVDDAPDNAWPDEPGYPGFDPSGWRVEARHDIAQDDVDDTPDSPRFFRLVRHQDETGVSGEGIVAYGVQSPRGQVIMGWDVEGYSTSAYDSIDTVRELHGHEGKTEVEFLKAVLLDPTEDVVGVSRVSARRALTELRRVQVEAELTENSAVAAAIDEFDAVLEEGD